MRKGADHPMFSVYRTADGQRSGMLLWTTYWSNEQEAKSRFLFETFMWSVLCSEHRLEGSIGGKIKH